MLFQPNGRVRLKSSEGLTGLVVQVGFRTLDVGCQLGTQACQLQHLHVPWASYHGFPEEASQEYPFQERK